MQIDGSCHCVYQACRQIFFSSGQLIQQTPLMMALALGLGSQLAALELQQQTVTQRCTHAGSLCGCQAWHIL